MRKQKGWIGFLRGKQYVIAGTLVILAAIATTVIYNDHQEKERAQMEAELAEEMTDIAESNQVAELTQETELSREKELSLGMEEEREQPSAYTSAVIPPETTAEEETDAAGAEVAAIEYDEEGVEVEEEVQETTSSNVETLHFAAEDGILWPTEGNVILNYSMDSTVYFATLDQYKYNPAVIISGEVNQKVYSVAPGRISAIENDEVTGCTVTVDLGDGYQAVYGQLKELNFAEGDYVESGHVLGYISEPTKYFSVEGSNLYFELLKDGSPIDPVECFQ